MAHRIQKHKKTTIFKEETHHTINLDANTPIAESPNLNLNIHKDNTKMPRPIIPSSNMVYIHEKGSFRKGSPAFPPAESLWKSNNVYDASPQFIRPVSALIPCQPKKSLIPLSVWITPMGSKEVHSIQLQSPLRCSRCKAYINPYFKFNGTKKSVTCNICGMYNNIEQSLDKGNITNTQLAIQGIIDLEIKNHIYYRMKTNFIKIILVIQISYNSIQLGVFTNIIAAIKCAIQYCQFQSNIRIGLVFFKDSDIGFLKLRNNWKHNKPLLIKVKVHPQAKYCCPLSNVELAFDPNNQKDKLLYLIDTIEAIGNQYYKNEKYYHNGNYGAALECLKEAYDNQTGRIILFSSLNPTAGQYHIRDRSQDEQKNLLTPISAKFQELSKQLLKKRIGLDHFVFTDNNHQCRQLATMHYLSTNTGGRIYLYNAYKHEKNSQNLYYTIYKTISKQYIYDVDYTCRVSNGLNIDSFGHYSQKRQTRDISLSVMDPSTSITVSIKQEQKIEQGFSAYLQFAMMFTTGDGKRKIRLINYRYPTTMKIQNLYQATDYLTFANILCREATFKILKNQPIKVRQDLIYFLAQIILQYKLKATTQNNKYSELAIHPCLANALAYIHTILNSKLFLNYIKINSDYRVNQVLKINAVNFYTFANLYYPKLYPISLDIYQQEPYPGDFLQDQDLDQNISVLPPNLPLTKASLKEDGAYLYNNTEYLLIIIMPKCPQGLLIELFGSNDLEKIEEESIPELESDHNVRVNNIINEIRRRNTANNGIYLPVQVITSRKSGPFNDFIRSIQKEDYGDCRYFEFLDTIHRKAQQLSK